MDLVAHKDHFPGGQLAHQERWHAQRRLDQRCGVNSATTIATTITINATIAAGAGWTNNNMRQELIVGETHSLYPEAVKSRLPAVATAAVDINGTISATDWWRTPK